MTRCKLVRQEAEKRNILKVPLGSDANKEGSFPWFLLEEHMFFPTDLQLPSGEESNNLHTN